MVDYYTATHLCESKSGGLFEGLVLMFHLDVKSYIKYNQNLRHAKMGMLMSKWAWNRKMCPRQFKRFFSNFTLPKASALFSVFLNSHRVAYSSAKYGDVSATKLFIFLS